ncbi:hypothetical protein J6590_056986 [Homalodisca vitripennis]|nr:hypothetical protein J6590_056986 [Homalodisca vitripennis]
MKSSPVETTVARTHFPEGSCWTKEAIEHIADHKPFLYQSYCASENGINPKNKAKQWKNEVNDCIANISRWEVTAMNADSSHQAMTRGSGQGRRVENWTTANLQTARLPGHTCPLGDECVA